MSRVRFALPKIKTFPDARPSACPHHGSIYLHRHGAVTKPVKDLHGDEVTVHRYRCCDCVRTFRHYPQGVDRHDQSHRLRGPAALCWALGLSVRSVRELISEVVEIGCGDE